MLLTADASAFHAYLSWSLRYHFQTKSALLSVPIPLPSTTKEGKETGEPLGEYLSFLESKTLNINRESRTELVPIYMNRFIPFNT